MWFLHRRGSKSGEEAAEALTEAELALLEVRERSGEVSELSQSFKDIRERNHFADQLEDLFTRRRRPLHD